MSSNPGKNLPYMRLYSNWLIIRPLPPGPAVRVPVVDLTGPVNKDVGTPNNPIDLTI